MHSQMEKIWSKIDNIIIHWSFTLQKTNPINTDKEESLSFWSIHFINIWFTFDWLALVSWPLESTNLWDKFLEKIFSLNIPRLCLSYLPITGITHPSVIGGFSTPKDGKTLDIIGSGEEKFHFTFGARTEDELKRSTRHLSTSLIGELG